MKEIRLYINIKYMKGYPIKSKCFLENLVEWLIVECDQKSKEACEYIEQKKDK